MKMLCSLAWLKMYRWTTLALDQSGSQCNSGCLHRVARDVFIKLIVAHDPCLICKYFGRDVITCCVMVDVQSA